MQPSIHYLELIPQKDDDSTIGHHKRNGRMQYQNKDALYRQVSQNI